MDERFIETPFTEIADAVRGHLAALPSPIDSFLEDHILASNHYRIEIDGERAGFASIHERRLITQFSLSGRHRRWGQRVFRELRRLEEVRQAFVPTCDELYLAHGLDDYRQLAKQAYFFALPGDARVPAAPSDFSLRRAEAEDAALVREVTGEFFEHIDRQIEAGQIFVTLRQAEPVGYGVLVRSALYDDVASIGMFTRESERRGGVGTATIALLIAECRVRGLRPVAGCWYYNHASKRTLERAGLVTATRLLRIDY